MKKSICLVLTVSVLLFAGALTEYAYAAQPYYGGGGHHYGGGGYYRGGSHYGGSIWIGPGWGPWWWGSQTYPYYSYYPNYQAPTVIRQEPSVYVQPTPQREEQSYWYYCPDPKGYYPYVKRCPKGWMKVLPSPDPEDEEE
jgi:hypothetical protein